LDVNYDRGSMLAFLSNLGWSELLLIALVAVLIFGKNLPQAASKAYMQVRKLRNAVDDLRRDSGIEQELRNIERSVREAEWEARKLESLARSDPKPAQPAGPPGASPAVPPAPAPPAAVAPGEAGGAPKPETPPTDASSC
jgi:Sec-independent protein translocase protein TatA